MQIELDRIATILKPSNNKGFLDMLGVCETTLRKYRKKKIPCETLLNLFYSYNLSPIWVKEGLEPQLFGKGIYIKLNNMQRSLPPLQRLLLLLPKSILIPQAKATGVRLSFKHNKVPIPLLCSLLLVYGVNPRWVNEGNVHPTLISLHNTDFFRKNGYKWEDSL